MGGARFARTWCILCATLIAALGVANILLGVIYDVDPPIEYQHTFFVVASIWMLPPLLLFFSEMGTYVRVVSS